MLNLSQSATLPKALASHHQSTESIFNISNRAPPVPADLTHTAKNDGLLAVLTRVGCGQVLLQRGLIIEVSETGLAILERESRHRGGHETLYSTFKHILNRAGAHIPLGSTSWLATSANDEFTTLVNQITNSPLDDTSVVILLDLDARPEPSPQTLQRLFKLTAAETQLAVEIARGKNLLDIARARRLSRTTVRSQLAALFVKTQTRRQADLVSLLGRIALLP